MSNSTDGVTYTLRRILQGLLAENPTATLVGAGIGVGFATAFDIVRALTQVVAPSVPLWASICFFAALFNIGGVLRRAALPPEINVALRLIDRAKYDGVPAAQVNLMYRRLFDYALDNNQAGITAIAAEAEAAATSVSATDSSSGPRG